MLERQGRGFDVHQRVLAGAEVVCETQRYYEYCEGSVRPRKSLESFVPTEGVRTGAQDWASPNFTGLISLGLEIGVFCDFLYSVLLFNAISGLDFSGTALIPAAGADRAVRVGREQRRGLAAGAPGGGASRLFVDTLCP